jgi:hypothetical protein
MNWRTHVEAKMYWLRARAAAGVRELVKEFQAEWRSRPLIRHLSALALCLLVVLVGVLERSAKRASVATAMTSMDRTVAAPQATPRGAAGAEGRLAALNRPVPPVARK